MKLQQTGQDEWQVLVCVEEVSSLWQAYADKCHCYFSQWPSQQHSNLYQTKYAIIQPRKSAHWPSSSQIWMKLILVLILDTDCLCAQLWHENHYQHYICKNKKHLITIFHLTRLQLENEQLPTTHSNCKNSLCKLLYNLKQEQ